MLRPSHKSNFALPQGTTDTPTKRAQWRRCRVPNPELINSVAATQRRSAYSEFREVGSGGNDRSKALTLSQGWAWGGFAWATQFKAAARANQTCYLS